MLQEQTKESMTHSFPQLGVPQNQQAKSYSIYAVDLVTNNAMLTNSFAVSPYEICLVVSVYHILLEPLSPLIPRMLFGKGPETFHVDFACLVVDFCTWSHLLSEEDSLKTTGQGTTPRFLVYPISGFWPSKWYQTWVPSHGVSSNWVRYLFATPTNSVPSLPQHILQAGQIIGQRFYGWVGVQFSFFIACKVASWAKRHRT